MHHDHTQILDIILIFKSTDIVAMASIQGMHVRLEGDRAWRGNVLRLWPAGKGECVAVRWLVDLLLMLKLLVL